MDLKPISPTTTLTNALPKMYDNWQEFYLYWHPWVLSTGQKHLSLTQWENGTVNQYEIDWSFVMIMSVKYGFSCTSRLPSTWAVRAFRFVRDFWRKVGLIAG